MKCISFKIYQYFNMLEYFKLNEPRIVFIESMQNKQPSKKYPDKWKEVMDWGQKKTLICIPCKNFKIKS